MQGHAQAYRHRLAPVPAVAVSGGGADLATLDRAADLIGAGHRYLICRTTAPVTDGKRGVLDLASAIDRLQHIAAQTTAIDPKRKSGK